MNVREEVSSCLVLAATLVLKDDLEPKDVEQAMLETCLALVWMRKLPGGAGARDRLEERVREELKRRRERRDEVEGKDQG